MLVAISNKSSARQDGRAIAVAVAVGFVVGVCALDTAVKLWMGVQG